MSVNAFIQARMSSRRFPGKVLVPLQGKPLVLHLIERVRQARGIDRIVVLTSTEPSDLPLVAYLEKIGCSVFCGDLQNVFLRFQAALKQYPCDYFVRLSGDSPFMNADLLSDVIAYAQSGDYEFITNVQSKMFPKGQSVEIVKSDLFLSVDAHSLTLDQQEHVMPYFYQAPIHKLSIDNVVDQRDINTCVDTIDDLSNMEAGKITFDYRGSVRGT